MGEFFLSLEPVLFAPAFGAAVFDVDVIGAPCDLLVGGTVRLPIGGRDGRWAGRGVKVWDGLLGVKVAIMAKSFQEE